MAFQLQYKDDSPDIIADRARMGTEVRESFFDLYSEDLKEASKVLALAFAGERRVFLCGTGSCYAVAALLQGRFINPPQAARGPLPAALLSARPMGNPDPLAEAGGTRIFARQLEAFGGDGDVLVLFTPDGNGSSLVEAARTAREQGMFTLGVSGGDGGRLADGDLLDIELRVPSIEESLVLEMQTAIACLLSEEVRRQMALSWGVTPLLMPRAANTDELIQLAVQAAEQAGLVRTGDLVVVTAGVPTGVSGTTNMIKVHLVGGALLNAVGIGQGSASGPVCICREPEEAAEKLRPGDVLVLPYTANAILPQLRQAAAIICEEPGANGHAATVGLTLGKPVIVGAAGATSRLRDGQYVTVDCTRGIVQALPH